MVKLGSEGRSDTSQHVKTEASQNTTDNMMLAGPLVVMVAVVVITEMTMYNEHGQLSDEAGGSNGYNNMPKKNM